MSEFEAQDPDFRARIAASFAKQTVMTTLGATLGEVQPGRVEISLPYAEKLTQQHDFVHAGVIATILDSACGYAAFTLMPADAGVLTVEYKINLLAPAKGQSFVASARVLRPGRTITVCEGEVRSDEGKSVAVMQATIMALLDRADVRG